MVISKRRIQSMKSMKRRIQSMKNMKSMKKKKGTRRAKSMGYKSIKSRKSSVSDNNIETSINAIISDINKKDLSINDKIEMISNELSKLPTIKFYGSLYIPNLSSLDNEEDAIELHNGGTKTRQDTLKQVYARQSKQLEEVDRNLETKRAEIINTENEIEAKENEPIREIEAKKVEKKQKKIYQLKKILEKKKLEISELNETKKSLLRDIEKNNDELERINTEDRKLEEEKAHFIETGNNIKARKKAAAQEAAEAAERAEAERAEAAEKAAPCKENLLTPFNNLFEEINENLQRFMTTINKINKEQEQEEMKKKLVEKINSLEENRKKYYDEEERRKKTGRYDEDGYINLTQDRVMGTLPEQGADKPKIAENFNLTNHEREEKYFNFIKEMYEKGYEKSEPSELSDYTKLFTEVVSNVSKFKDSLERNLELSNIKILVNRLREDDPGTVLTFYKIAILEPHVDPLGHHSNYPRSTNDEYFHLTIHLGDRDFEGHHYHNGKVHLAKHEFNTARNEYIPNRKYSLNMRPYIFTQVEGDNKNKSWPERCIQVIPIYNTDVNHDNRLQIILVEELNKFIWQLQIDDVKNKLWTADKKKMEKLMGSYIQAKLPKVIVMLRREQLTPIIPKMIEEIKKLKDFFKEENIHKFLRTCLTVPESREDTLQLIKKCKTLFEQIKQFLITESNLIYTDTATAEEDARKIFNEFLESCKSDTYIDKLDISDQDKPDTTAIEGVINDVESELTSAEASSSTALVAPAATPAAEASSSSAVVPPAPAKKPKGKEKAGRGRKNKITRKKTNKYSIYKIKSKKKQK